MKAYLHISGITGTGTKLHHGWIELIQYSVFFPVEGSTFRHAKHLHKGELEVMKEPDGASRDQPRSLSEQWCDPGGDSRDTSRGQNRHDPPGTTFKNGKVMAINVVVPESRSGARTRDIFEHEHVTFSFETVVGG